MIMVMYFRVWVKPKRPVASSYETRAADFNRQNGLSGTFRMKDARYKKLRRVKKSTASRIPISIGRALDSELHSVGSRQRPAAVRSAGRAAILPQLHKAPQGRGSEPA